MAENRKYLVLGTGAIGGFYGAKLCKSGLDVHFLLRSDYDHVKRHGLTVTSAQGRIDLPRVQAYSSPKDMPQGDVVLVATKAVSNHDLKKLVEPVLKPSSIVILLQNGLGGEEVLAGFVPPKQIYGGLAFICAARTGPGLINHQDYGSIRIGAYNPDGVPAGITPELREIITDFTAAGIEASPAPDLLLSRWEKLAWNIPFSGLSVLLDADTREIVGNPDSAALAKLLIRDVALAAQACGKPIADSFQRKMFDSTITMVPYSPSLKLDYDAGRRMETEAIFGNPLRASQNAGYPAPYIEMVYRQLKFLELIRRSASPNRSLHTRR